MRTQAAAETRIKQGEAGMSRAIAGEKARLFSLPCRELCIPDRRESLHTPFAMLGEGMGLGMRDGKSLLSA